MLFTKERGSTVVGGNKQQRGLLFNTGAPGPGRAPTR